MRILFDLDGTLTDPFPGITNCIRHALEKLDVSEIPAAEDLRWCIGPPLHGSFRTLLNTSDDSVADEALAIYRERFGEVGLFENEVFAGIRECLSELSRAGNILSVATSKPTVYATRIIEHFELREFFVGVDGSELDGTRGDKTSLIAHILKRDELRPNEVMMIGDRKFDITGAADNDVRGIGVLWGYGSRDELEEAGASRLVESPGELVDAIESR